MKTHLEYRLKADDQLCFIHIPKTAGTTFTSIIDQKFNVDEICPELVNLQKVSEAQEEGISIAPERVAKYKLIRGHFSYDTIDRFLLKKPLYLTILRNPLDRTISLYEFLKRAKEKGEPEYNEDTKVLRDATDQGLEAFVSNANPTVKARTSNPQTRILALQPQVDRSDAELLAIAKANLEQFILVGLTERFQDSVFLLSYLFGWCPATSFYSLRVASNKPSRENLPQTVIDTIIQYNQLDFELYQFAEKLFADRFTQMLEILQQKYGQSVSAHETEAIAALLERHYEQRYAEQQIFQPTIDFDFQQAMSGTGWHRRNGRHNGLKANTTTFRWTGPSTQSTLDFSLTTDADLSVKLRIINAVTPEVLASLKLTVNHYPIALQTLFQQGNITVLQGLIPQSALLSDRPFTRFTFTVDRTLSLKEAKPGNPDQRQVGLAFHRIQIQPVARSPQDPDYLYLLFPLADPHWIEADQFLSAQVQPHEIIVAPNEFYEKYPQQIRFYNAANRATLLEQPRVQVQWVAIHKGQLEAIDSAFLKWTMQALHPVFANEVFVIFTERQDVAKLSARTPHLQAFWAMQPRSLPVKIWHKLKAILK